MSENNNIQNEEELWDLLSEPVTTEPKADKPKPEPAPKEEPAAKPEPAAKAAEPKPAKKIDGFFVACMAGVAAVSVALTLVVSSMFGGSANTVKSPSGESAGNGVVAEQTDEVAALQKENAELRAQLEQQKEQVKQLQNDLITLMGSEEYLSTASTDPDGSSEELSAQMQALDTFAQIQEAYADFDRERLEELIPEMDKQLSYLTPEMLNSYYLILEYVEQPSNG